MARKIDPETVAMWSRQVREAGGLTQRQLARKLGCKHGVIGAMERGVIRSQRIARAVLMLTPDEPENLI